MTPAEITAYVMALPVEDVRRLSATDVMRWRLVDIHERTDGSYWVPCMAWMDADGIAGHLVSYWTPDEDRNQSRMVTDRAMELYGADALALGIELIVARQGGSVRCYITAPLDETRAALIAHMIHKQEAGECHRGGPEPMTPREMDLLELLAEKLPVRFGFGRDLDGEFFHDAELGGVSFYFSLPELWIMRILESLDIAAIWKEEGRTWRESILNAIVHKLTEMPEDSRGK